MQPRRGRTSATIAFSIPVLLYSYLKLELFSPSANAVAIGRSVRQNFEERIDVVADAGRDDEVELDSILQHEIDSKGRVTNIEDALDVGTSLDRQAGQDRSGDDARFTIGLLLIHTATLLMPPGFDTDREVKATGIRSISAKNLWYFLEGMRSSRTEGLDFPIRSLPPFSRLVQGQNWRSTKNPSDLLVSREMETDGTEVSMQTGFGYSSIFAEDEDD
ncbi:hypothetical protein [Rhodococcus sp. NPDC060176]|uniref:hypothetical protein n=1 Tax=Rhodococcus sp. NPDC060176 TaxID=3347062 RepID=UPI00365B3FFD